MAKIKNARSGEYMISQNAEGAIKVAKDYENDKAALREIAEKVGFHNTDYFISKFVQEKGMTPLQYRKAMTKKR